MNRSIKLYRSALFLGYNSINFRNSTDFLETLYSYATIKCNDYFLRIFCESADMLPKLFHQKLHHFFNFFLAKNQQCTTGKNQHVIFSPLCFFSRYIPADCCTVIEINAEKFFCQIGEYISKAGSFYSVKFSILVWHFL